MLCSFGLLQPELRINVRLKKSRKFDVQNVYLRKINIEVCNIELNNFYFVSIKNDTISTYVLKI